MTLLRHFCPAASTAQPNSLGVTGHVVRGVASPVRQDDAVGVYLFWSPARPLVVREQPDVVRALAGIPERVVGADPVQGMPVHANSPLHTVVPAHHKRNSRDSKLRAHANRRTHAGSISGLRNDCT